MSKQLEMQVLSGHKLHEFDTLAGDVYPEALLIRSGGRLVEVIVNKQPLEDIYQGHEDKNAAQVLERVVHLTRTEDRPEYDLNLDTALQALADSRVLAQVVEVIAEVRVLDSGTMDYSSVALALLAASRYQNYKKP